MSTGVVRCIARSKRVPTFIGTVVTPDDIGVALKEPQLHTVAMPPSAKLLEKRATLLLLIEIGARVRREHGDPRDDAEWEELTRSCTRQASVAQLQRDYLVEWNERVGAVVEAFWQEVERKGLDLERRNDVVVETLRRGRVLHPGQFHALEDHFEELQTCGKISREEAKALGEMLDRFEADPKSFSWVRTRF